MSKKIALYADDVASFVGTDGEEMALSIDRDHYEHVIGHDGYVPAPQARLLKKLTEFGFIATDADTQLFSARALEDVAQRIYQVEYPPTDARRLIPLGESRGQWVKSITFREFDWVGFARIMTSLADDAPLINVRGKEYNVDVVPLRAGYKYDVDQIAQAAHTNTPLSLMLNGAIRGSFEQEVNRLAWMGDEKTGRPGFYTNPNITVSEAPPSGGSGNDTKWVDKTNDEIYADMIFAVTNPEDLTNGVEQPVNGRLLLPIAQYNLIRSRRMASGTDTTILKFFLDNNPGIKVEKQVYLKNMPVNLFDGTVEATDAMMFYSADPSKVTLEIPMDFTQFPPEARNLAWVVNCMMHYAGVQWMRPLSAHLTTRI